jgi:methionyl-tRNA formyltransferase
MKDLKVVFMGTPDFSVNVLNNLIHNTSVIGVVTKPDKLVGRKQVLSQSAVKKVAIANNIKVLQPTKIKEEYQSILDLSPDIIITCAYGQFLPKEILDFPKYGCVNVHASLLPKLRGGAPIHKAIIEGYTTTGITIMYMGQKMDNGDIISQKSIEIENMDNVGTLHDKLSVLGADLLMETIPDIISGKAKRIVQNEEEITFAYNISREEEHIDFNKTKTDILNQIRGLNPWPVAYAILDGEEMKIYEVIIGEGIYKDKLNGEIVKLYKDGIGIKVSDGEIILKSIKCFGKKKMNVSEYLNGIRGGNNLIGKVFS